MNILLGIGGGPDGDRALDRVLDRVAGTGDSLTIVIVDNPTTEVDHAALEARVRETVTDAAVSASVRAESGDPGSTLVEIAETEDFDLIAIGGGERSPMGKIQLGPMTEFIVLNATVSVWLVR